MRILIVEDEPKIAQAIKRGLAQEGFSADIVEDGDSAVSYGSSSEYDLILLDWMIPGSFDGPAVCAELRKDKVKTPILMRTAKGQIRDRVTGLNGGADDYMQKPFSFDELVARIHALLRRPAGLLDTDLKVGKLVLNSASKQVTYGKHEVQLTAKEFNLLEYLMRNQERVISKDELIEHIWSDDDDILPNTVEVYIGYLRNKIDKPFEVDFIKTIRGFGYRVSPG